MAMTTNDAIELEGLESAESVMAHYDAGADRWNLPEQGPFWDAVRLAHAQGIFGQGKRVTVIDGGCDYAIPRIRRQTGGGPRFSILPGQSTVHGTIVALFIGRVAPQCQLDIYEVTVNGKPDANAIQHAMRVAENSDASIINLSLGIPRDLDWPETEPCAFCLSAIEAHEHGKLVLAAAGNDSGKVYCPASNEHCVAVGHRLERRWIEQGLQGGYELAQWAPPSYSQSRFTRIATILQEPGVAGTSFATPLLAGFSALLEHPLEVSDFTLSAAFASDGAVWLSLGEKTFAETSFENALQHLPHRHTNTVDGPPCVACAFFALDYYINAGLHYLRSMNLDRAEPLMRTAVWLAPSSPQATANLGRLLEERAIHAWQGNGNAPHALALLHEAQALYTTAVKAQPGGVFEAELRKILSMQQALATGTI